MRIRPFTHEDVSQAARLYCTCFAEPPWFESFDPREVTQEMEDILARTDAAAQVAVENGRVVGAAYGFDLATKDDVAALVRPAPPAFYVSEIFVAPDRRVRGTARTMTQALLRQAAAAGYVDGAVRTSVDQPAILRLFAGLGWTVAAEQTVVSPKLVDGQTVHAPDRRVILTGRL